MSLSPEHAYSTVGETQGLDIAARHPAYHVRALQFQYNPLGRGADQWVLDGVSFDIEPGEILGIVGPNGSGKTSLLKLLAKVLKPHAGDIALFGRELASMPQLEVARTVAFVPQESPQVFSFTVMETVLMGRYPHHQGATWSAGFSWESAEDILIAEQAMRYTDLTHLASRSVMDLSGGERQRCMIARALAQAPRVLLLDEPTAFLDLQHQIAICAIVRRLKEERGLTVVLVSHDLNVASQYCDRILMLKAGVLFRLGSPHEVIDAEVLRAVYGCDVLVDRHPESGVPRVTMPGYRSTKPF
ncbi:MAG TPA: ABC transporter ATP-binding protein [Nitrospiraceae bacterium]|nr:ABC transporter ATP-binding protein [Nitrospiraceae bacterium]